MAVPVLTSAALLTLIRYGSVGVINTLVGAGVMVALSFMGFHYSVYTAGGYLIAFVTSYVLNGLFTFKAGPLSYRGFARFITLNGALLLGVEVLQAFLIEIMHVPELLGVFVGMIVYMFVGFVLNRTIIYRAA